MDMHKMNCLPHFHHDTCSISFCMWKIMKILTWYSYSYMYLVELVLYMVHVQTVKLCGFLLVKYMYYQCN